MPNKIKQQQEEENKSTQKTEENQEIQKEIEAEVHIGINTDDNEGKILIETKPREEYLQKKLDEMNIENSVINGVSKGLGLSLDFIKNDIDDDKILITEVTNDNKIKKYVFDNEEKEKNHKTDEQNIISKLNLKKLRDCREEKDKLNNKILKLETKKQFIENEGMMNLNEVDKNIKNNEIKKIKNETSLCNARINVLEYQIKNILAEEFRLRIQVRSNNYIRESVQIVYWS